MHLRSELVIRGLLANRGHPDLESLAAETEPDRFVWEVLPHTARSFAASISILPKAQARAAAVAYLYCRMLDTYEDLSPDEAAPRLERFAARFDSTPRAAPDPIPGTAAADDRDQVHLLLVERCHLVDSVYDTLPRKQQDGIARLIRAMANDMAASAQTLRDQGGVLISEDQAARYCHGVIGHPVLFVLDLLGIDASSPAMERDALDVSEMIQLANISRDIEADLQRGIGYHPALLPYLGTAPQSAAARENIRRSREQHVRVALRRAPAYRRLFRLVPAGDAGPLRAAATLMLGFTDLHYRRMLARTGHHPWRGPQTPLGVVMRALPALASKRWAERYVRRLERRFLEGARRLPPTWDFTPADDRR